MSDKDKLLKTILQVVGPYLDSNSAEVRVKKYLSQHLEAYQIIANKLPVPVCEHDGSSTEAYRVPD